MMNDLVERLRQQDRNHVIAFGHGTILTEAADALIALQRDKEAAERQRDDAYMADGLHWANRAEAAERALDDARARAIEECARVCDSVNNYDNPMTATDCADAIRALSDAPAERDTEEPTWIATTATGERSAFGSHATASAWAGRRGRVQQAIKAAQSHLYAEPPDLALLGEALHIADELSSAERDTEDARDARRYRWVRANFDKPWPQSIFNTRTQGDMDAAIDAALSAKEGQ